MVERATGEKERWRVQVEVTHRGRTKLVWLHLARHAPLQPRALLVGEKVLGLRALEDIWTCAGTRTFAGWATIEAFMRHPLTLRLHS